MTIYDGITVNGNNVCTIRTTKLANLFVLFDLAHASNGNSCIIFGSYYNKGLICSYGGGSTGTSYVSATSANSMIVYDWNSTTISFYLGNKQSSFGNYYGFYL